MLEDFTRNLLRGWGSSGTDARGKVVEEGAVTVGLCLLNGGTTNM